MNPKALISVSDKHRIIEFSRKLINLGYEIISTGGTAALLKANNLPITTVEDVTHFPECLDGRVKTLHPHIHGGILSVRDNPAHMKTISDLGITPIDIVVVNLYPFREVIKTPGHTLEQAIENIDIGGPSMIRAAAKNYRHVTVVTDGKYYETVLERLRGNTLDEDFRFMLASKAFAHTAAYDAMISGYLNEARKEEYPDILTLSFEKKQSLRYGENPHQNAAYYQTPLSNYAGVEKAVCLHGKELSYNNINDAGGAVALAYEFDEPVCVAVKHSTPCGVGVADCVSEAFTKAYEADPVSIFGGIVCLNREVDIATAKKMHEIFLEVIIAPSYSDEALACLTTKKNVRVLILPELNDGSKAINNLEFKSVGGGLLVQQTDTTDIGKPFCSSGVDQKEESVHSFVERNFINEHARVVTEKSPDKDELDDLMFALKVVKHVKSNAIVVAKGGQTLGIGGGEVSRIWAAEAALARAGEKSKGAVLASDAFFPFNDVVKTCGAYGINAIIQPGGSKNDGLSIDECNRLGISMIFTGMRHFKH